jgi:prophage antirepressor-like protein
LRRSFILDADSELRGIKKMDKNMETKLAVFRGKEIRKIIAENEWWFSVVDVIEVLTDSTNPRDYWYRLNSREKNSTGVELSTFCRRLKLVAKDGN